MVMSPSGVALIRRQGAVLIAVPDGKGLFFSINVDAAEARAWESRSRPGPKPAVRAIPGVTTAMIALTAERKPDRAAPPPSRQGRHTPRSFVVPPCHPRICLRISAHRRWRAGGKFPGLPRVIAVASGKGGVGKSTTRAHSDARPCAILG